MTLNEQHTYVLKIEQKCKELGYEFGTNGILEYFIKGKEIGLFLRQNGENFYIRAANMVTDTWIHQKEKQLPEFLDTYFQDMLNPTDEERTIWELETGTEWIF